MKMLTRLQKLIKGKYIFWLGLAIICLSFIPYLILGTGSYVEYFEQLDWGLLTYIYQAKYLFSSGSVIPEFLNGASKNALVEPAFGYVFVFRVLNPFAAYLVMQFSEQVIAYVGLYLLLDRVTEHKMLSVLVALMFAFLPFLAVFGLTIFGVPLAAWAILNLYERKRERLSFACIVVFTLFSSLILGGFAIIMLWTILLVFSLIRKHRQSAWMYASYLSVIVLYLMTNLDLVLQFLGIGETYVSHRADKEIEVHGFAEYFAETFFYNDQHTIDFHRFFLPVIFLALCIFLIRAFLSKKKDTKTAYFEAKQGCLAAAVFGLLLFLYLIAALWNISPIVSVREMMGGLGSFNAARVIWLAPAGWYFLLGVSLEYILRAVSGSGRNCMDIPESMASGQISAPSGQRRNGLQKSLTWIAYAGLCIGFLLILKENQLKENVQLLLNPDYDVITYEEYYAIDLMEEVEDYIREELGMEMEEYRVISLGIDPAAALYHGFYCMDGYSDNYDVEYKYLFRTFMAAELERNEYIRSYYDDWGNRVYLFTAELTTYFNVEKGSFWFNDLQIDTAAIKDAGCDFIFSAAYVVNAEELNMELLATFETEESYYRIYLYRIAD
ncbi:MAG: DUF6044 family protein [Lachnospiraceae bacterium]|nr:DUF6044 family protein [Lachnospiraceae bacterium]